MSKVCAPVAVFGYNRKDKLQKCIESLENCNHSSETDVIVFSDGFKSEKDMGAVNETRAYLDSLSENNTFHSLKLVKRPENYGLAKSIISGVTQVLSEYDSIIVVEDDLILARDFLEFMNAALEFYKNNKKMGSVSAYTYPLKALKNYSKDFYVVRKADCWGWGTWKDRWDGADWEVKDFDEYYSNKRLRKEFDKLETGLDAQLVRQHNKELDAWAARWIYYLYRNELLTVYPAASKAINIGLDGSGTNCQDTDTAFFGNSIIQNSSENFVFEDTSCDKKIERAIYEYSKPRKSVLTYIGYLYSGVSRLLHKE